MPRRAPVRMKTLHWWLMPLRLLVYLVFGLSGLAIAAQNPAAAPQPETPAFREKVRQVLVPVVVTDKKGHHIAGLKASDFQISEDGVPQGIVAFAMAGDSAGPGDSGSPAAPRAAPEAGAPRRAYLICVDTLHSAPGSFSRVRDILSKFFEHEQDAGSQYALVALGQHPIVVHEFTTDASAILAALHSKSLLGSVSSSESSNIGYEVNEFSDLMQRYCEVCDCTNYPKSIGKTSPDSCTFMRSAVHTFLESSSGRTAVLTENFLLTLNQMVQVMARMAAPAGRTVLLISDGFNSTPGQELYGVVQAYGPTNDRDFQLNPNNKEDRIQVILQAAVKSNVKFYTLDSRGMYTAASAPGSSISTNKDGLVMRGGRLPPTANIDQGAVSMAWQNGAAMSELAHATGGLFFENSNDLLKGLRRAFADGREYYVLAYSPKNKVLDGKYRAITVEVKDKKLQVQAKAGYWATEN